MTATATAPRTVSPAMAARLSRIRASWDQPRKYVRITADPYLTATPFTDAENDAANALLDDDDYPFVAPAYEVAA